MKQIVDFLNPSGDIRKSVLLLLAILVLILSVVNLQLSGHQHSYRESTPNQAHAH